MPDYDYIVVGGGSAGCALASRLSVRASIRVLLIEAGRDYPPGDEPAHIRDTFYTAAYVRENLWPDTRVHWLAPRPGSPAAPAFYEQARVIGGGSSVNAMVGLRGTPADFAEWTAMGAAGWSWDEVLPFYRRLERDLDFAGEHHGREGPIPIRRHPRDEWPPFVAAVARELASRGCRYLDDVNAGERDGYGRIPMTSLPERRGSAATGYLDRAVRRRENLRILAGSEVGALAMEGRQVTGVRVRRGERDETFRAREVVLCAGAYRSPALLLRSGIGPPRELADLGIAVRAALPGVGRNLHDHPAFAAAAHLRRGARQPARQRPHANAGLFYSSGLAGCPPLDMYLPIASKVSWHALGRRIGGLFPVLMKPFSRGRVTLHSPDPRSAPRVEVNAFGDPRDLARVMQAMRFARELLARPAVAALTTWRFGGSFSERVRALNAYRPANGVRAALAAALLDGPSALRDLLMRRVICPDAELDALVADDARLEAWLRENVTGFFHPVGTCRMGAPDDRRAVVDPGGRVRGVAGLRVADASVMPVIVRATTNLTAIMIGEKIAQAILDDEPGGAAAAFPGAEP